jgi:hypothetical protein
MIAMARAFSPDVREQGEFTTSGFAHGNLKKRSKGQRCTYQSCFQHSVQHSALGHSDFEGNPKLDPFDAHWMQSSAYWGFDGKLRSNSSHADPIIIFRILA